MGCMFWVTGLSKGMGTLQLCLLSTFFGDPKHEWVCGACTQTQGRRAKKTVNMKIVFKDSRNRLCSADVE